jgi:hypothetical protein
VKYCRLILLAVSLLALFTGYGIGALASTLSIMLESPASGSSYTTGVFNIDLSATVTDAGGDIETVEF